VRLPAVPVSACLIVRDEASRIARCLTALAPYVDEIVVADTGSTDGTADIARALGAHVVDVAWRDDFAEARNAAAAACAHDWVLSIDADEVPRGEPGAFREALAEVGPGIAAVSLAIVESGAFDPRGSASHRAVKVYRRSLARWQGRVHEHVAWRRGVDAGRQAPALRFADELVAMEHDGYADPAVVARKARRNLRLSRLEVADLDHSVATGLVPRDRWVKALLDLGRTELVAGDAGAAVTLERVRTVTVPGAEAWVWATDFLAWEAHSRDDLVRVCVLLDELVRHGADERHVRPLRERVDALPALAG
jgi:glycosyltransferase involved in cell wall biosynthesis